MKTTPFLSIITINYNNEVGLKKTINSVFEQTCKDYEYIIIDGGSSDKSNEIIQDCLSSKDKNEHISFCCSEKDKGIYDAMNKGVSHANGKYLYFLNSGDTFYDSTVLEKIKNLNCTEEFIYGNVFNISRNKIIKPSNKIDYLFFYEQQALCHQGVFIKTELQKKYNYSLEYKIASDWDFFFKSYAKDNAKFKYVDIIFSYYEGNGISSQLESKKIIEKERLNMIAYYIPKEFIPYFKELQEYEHGYKGILNKIRKILRLIKKIKSNHKKTIYIYPVNNYSNKYSKLQEKAISTSDTIISYSFKDFFHIDIFILNWFESLGNNIYFDFIKKQIKIFLFKLFKKKIFWIVHNKQPHIKNSKTKNSYLSIILMKKLLKISSKIIILCNETNDILKNLNPNFESYSNKIIKIPHPNYIDVYKTYTINKPMSSKIKFLYIGTINPYKNLDLLIECFNTFSNQNIELNIHGECNDKNYSNYLKNKIKNKNIHYNFEFIPDDEIAPIILNNDIIILPYSLDSSLNSGTIILSFSLRKTVISPLIGTLKEYNDKSFFYSYTYNTKDEHIKKISEKICEVIDEVSTNPNILIQKGELAYNLVKEENSLEKISTLYSSIIY